MAQTVFELDAKLNLDDKDFYKSLDKAEGRLDRFGGNARTAGGAADVAKGALGGLGGMFSSLGKTIPVAGAGLVAVGGVVAGLGVGASKTLGKYTQFQKGMNEVFSLIGDDSVVMRNQLENDVDSLAQKYGILSEDAIPALYTSISAGIPPQNVGTFLETAAEAATAGVTSLDIATQGIIGTISAYNLETSEATAVSDSMFTAVRLGRTNFEELSRAIAVVAPIASAVGVSYDEMNAAIAASTLVTGNANVAATGMRQAMAELSKEGAIANKNFKEAAGVTFPEFIEQGGTLAEALQLMDKHAKANDKSMVDMFGSIEAGQIAMILAQDNAKVLTENMDEMDAKAGSTAAAYETMEGSMANTWAKIKGNIDVALKEIGGFFAPWVETISGWIAEKLPAAVNKLKEFIRPVRLALQQFFSGVGEDGEKGVSFLGKLFEAAKVVFGKVWENISAVISWAWENLWFKMKSVMIAPIKAIQKAFIRFATWAPDLLLSVLSWITDLIPGWLRRFIPGFSAFSAANTGLDNLISSMEDRIDNWEIGAAPDKLDLPGFGDIWDDLGLENPFERDAANQMAAGADRKFLNRGTEIADDAIENATDADNKFFARGAEIAADAVTEGVEEVMDAVGSVSAGGSGGGEPVAPVQRVMGATPEFIAGLMSVGNEVRDGADRTVGALDVLGSRFRDGLAGVTIPEFPEIVEVPVVSAADLARASAPAVAAEVMSAVQPTAGLPEMLEDASVPLSLNVPSHSSFMPSSGGMSGGEGDRRGGISGRFTDQGVSSETVIRHEHHYTIVVDDRSKADRLSSEVDWIQRKAQLGASG